MIKIIVPIASYFLIFLAGCASQTGDPSEGRFRVNGIQGTVVNAQMLQVIRQAWQPVDANLRAKSKVDDNWQWTQDFIATTSASGVAACSNLSLLEIRQQTIQPFAVSDNNGKKTKHTPSSYYESWLVDTCGKVNEWRVLDEASDPGNSHRVLFWRAG